MYSTNHNVENAVLTVINDGDGSQCGMDYKERCRVAEFGLADFYTACKRYNPELSKKEAREGAELLQSYYQEHVKEGA